jgi:hypothetical protein
MRQFYFYFLNHICVKFTHTHKKKCFACKGSFLLEKLEEIEHDVAIVFYNS